MSEPIQSSLGNCLLRRLPAEAFAMLAPHLEAKTDRKGDVLIEAGAPLTWAFFPDIGLGSVVAISPEGQRVETGLFGFDGMTPIAAVLGAEVSAFEHLMHVPGQGHRIGVDVLRDAARASPPLLDTLLRYAQAMMVQACFTALSNAVHSVEERLARWLLMCHDRTEGDEIVLTHEFMSIALAVRRPSVTTALHVLEGTRLIRSDRGRVTIRDRKSLEEFASNSYGQSEAEYARLLGPIASLHDMPDRAASPSQ